MFVFKRNTHFQVYRVILLSWCFMKQAAKYLLKHHVLALLPENSSSGNHPAPCKHLVPHPLNKTRYRDCLQTATADTTLLKFIAPSIGPESSHSKQERWQQQLCIFKGQRGLGRLGGEKPRSSCPLDPKPVQHSQVSGSVLDTDHAGFIDG